MLNATCAFLSLCISRPVLRKGASISKRVSNFSQPALNCFGIQIIFSFTNVVVRKNRHDLNEQGSYRRLQNYDTRSGCFQGRWRKYEVGRRETKIYL